MFPPAGAQVYYNDYGEPLGWDMPNYDEPPDPDDWYEQTGWDTEDYYYAAEVWDTCQCGDVEFGACGKDTCRDEYETTDGDMKTEDQWALVRDPSGLDDWY